MHTATEAKCECVCEHKSWNDTKRKGEYLVCDMNEMKMVRFWSATTPNPYYYMEHCSIDMTKFQLLAWTIYEMG